MIISTFATRSSPKAEVFTISAPFMLLSETVPLSVTHKEIGVEYAAAETV